MPSVVINGCSIHYQRSGQGPATVFVHGGFANLASQLKLPAGGEWEWSREPYVWRVGADMLDWRLTESDA
jgi:pimeloyl-ACP methyl ester carboxylesterase